MTNYIVLAIPVFFLLIGVELLWTWLQERPYYRLNDSIGDLSCGILEQVGDVFLKSLLFAGYLFVYGRFRLFEIPANAAAFVACWLGVDFLYYWFHRWSHEVNAGWAAHIVHHQSEEYNLTVALRQSVLQGSLSWVFYLPLALLGFPPLVFLSVSSLNTLYQFWIHTRAIGRLGPLEWVLNTPSHHRVHHGRNPKYIDRNHAGSLIIWDRMFGTFQAEEEEPVYGITTPLSSFNPVWANLHYWVALFESARRAARPFDRLRIFWKAPGWLPEDLGGYQPAPEVDPDRHRKYDPVSPLGRRVYVLVQFAVVNLAASVFLFGQGALTRAGQATAALAILISVVALGALLERGAWATVFEATRLLALGAGALAILPGPYSLAVAALALASGAWLFRQAEPASQELAAAARASGPRP